MNTLFKNLLCGADAAADDGSSIADTFYMTEQCFSKATGTQDKELFLIPGATHIQTYWVPEYVDQTVKKLTEFFGKRL